MLTASKGLNIRIQVVSKRKQSIFRPFTNATPRCTLLQLAAPRCAPLHPAAPHCTRPPPDTPDAHAVFGLQPLTTDSTDTVMSFAKYEYLLSVKSLSPVDGVKRG